MGSGTLEASRKERDRLDRDYRAAKDRRFAELCDRSACGEQLHDFVKTLGHFHVEHSDRFCKYVQDECRKWLRAEPVDIRFVALQAVDDRIIKIRLKAGMPEISDPLPGDPDNVFFICKIALGL